MKFLNYMFYRVYKYMEKDDHCFDNMFSLCLSILQNKIQKYNKTI